MKLARQTHGKVPDSREARTACVFLAETMRECKGLLRRQGEDEIEGESDSECKNVKVNSPWPRPEAVRDSHKDSLFPHLLIPSPPP